jgi:hypothetical protein
MLRRILSGQSFHELAIDIAVIVTLPYATSRKVAGSVRDEFMGLLD